MKPLILFLIFILTNMCCAGTGEESIPDHKYIEYGKKYKCVYKICGTYKDGKLFCASAIVIDRHWIITAAHVVNNARFCVVSQDDKANMVDEIIVHENFNPNKFGSTDMALGYMEKPIDLNFYPSLYEENNEQGKICSIVGYGFTGNFKTGSIIGDDKKRAGTNMIQYIDRDLLICNASQPNDKDSTGLEFLIASGDSGGGLFIDGRLAGINSGVLAADKIADSSYTDESAHTRISTNIRWIKEKMKSRNLRTK